MLCMHVRARVRVFVHVCVCAFACKCEGEWERARVRASGDGENDVGHVLGCVLATAMMLIHTSTTLQQTPPLSPHYLLPERCFAHCLGCSANHFAKHLKTRLHPLIVCKYIKNIYIYEMLTSAHSTLLTPHQHAFNRSSLPTFYLSLTPCVTPKR